MNARPVGSLALEYMTPPVGEGPRGQRKADALADLCALLAERDELKAALADERAHADALDKALVRACALLPDAADMLSGDAYDNDKRRIAARRVMADSLCRVYDDSAALTARRAAQDGGAL